MTEPLDWAPYASDGKEFRMLPPLGMTYSLTTDDIFKAKPTPSIRQYLHGEAGDKMVPQAWLPKKPAMKFHHLETGRIVNPLDPKYKLPSGICLIPAGDPIPFSNRVTDLMDTSDISGSKPASFCKRPIRTCRLHCYIDDVSFHPAKRTHQRRRTTIGQGLDLYDIDTGKRQFGFNRQIISNPLEPAYYSETEDFPHRNHNWKKRQVLPPHSDRRNSFEKILDNIHTKVEMLPKVCQHFDHGNTNQITCGDFRKTLENLGINLSQKEMMEVLNFADKEHTGHVRYRWFAKVLKSLDSWEKTFPQRLGAELGCPPRNANLGQGVQVLVDVKQKSSHITNGFQKSSPYDLLTGEANEDIQATGFLREPKYSSYAERAAALSKHKHEFGIIEQIYCPPQWSFDKSTKVCPEIPLELNARLTEHAEKCPEEENAINSQEDGVRCATTQGASHAVSVAAEYLALQPKPEETITKREDIRSPKKSRQMAMAPYRATNSITMEANLHSISPPRILKTRHIVSMPFKERIHKEQHSEDLYAVQILS